MSNYITEEEQITAGAVFKERGMEGLKEYLQSKMDRWKTVPLNIGVIGNSGCGKSSFINAVRGLTADDEGAAAVGVTETTMEPTPYSHPNNPLVQFWDLPGVGTPRFPRETYLEAIGFEKYDFFLILTSERFKENDAWIGQEIVKKSKKFYFVRTKIGPDVKGDKRAHPTTHDAEKAVQKIRENIESHLKEMGVDAPIFLIDNYKPLKYDFGQLGPKLIEDLPEIKREVMIHTTFAFSAEMVKKKIELLRAQVWAMAITSAGVAAIPVPGVSVAFDTACILVAMVYFVRTMRLSDGSLKRLAATSRVSFMVLRESANVHFNINVLNGVSAFAELLKTIPMYVAESAAEQALSFLPIVGSILAAGVSFGKTIFTLRWILDKIEKASLAVIQKALGGGTLPSSQNTGFSGRSEDEALPQFSIQQSLEENGCSAHHMSPVVMDGEIQLQRALSESMRTYPGSDAVTKDHATAAHSDPVEAGELARVLTLSKRQELRRASALSEEEELELVKLLSLEEQ